MRVKLGPLSTQSVAQDQLNLDVLLSEGDVLSSQSKLKIVETLYGLEAFKLMFSPTDPRAAPFWQSYAERCRRAFDISVRTHRELLGIAQVVRDGKSREEVRAEFQQAATNELFNNSMNLAASVLTMSYIGNYQMLGVEREIMPWKDESGKLTELMSTWITPQHHMKDVSVKLESWFTALALVRIGNLKIIWTDNFLDHLRLANDDQAICIFHYFSFLCWQIARYVTIPAYVLGSRQLSHVSEHRTIPKEAAKEAKLTMALLFPSNNKELRKWCEKQAELSSIDPGLWNFSSLNIGDRQIGEFKYFHDRLAMLKQRFDEIKPKTLPQFWHDDRDGPRWWGFINAMVILALTLTTLFFGLVQIFESGAAIQLARVANDWAEKQAKFAEAEAQRESPRPV